jgi:hypothetical protein
VQFDETALGGFWLRGEKTEKFYTEPQKGQRLTAVSAL